MSQAAMIYVLGLVVLGLFVRAVARRSRRRMKPIWFHERGDWQVVLLEHDRLQAAMVVRASLSLTIDETLKLIADPPCRLVTEVTRADAQTLVDRLLAVGARAELRPM